MSENNNNSNGDTYRRRNEAKRVFLREILRTDYTEKEGDDQFAPVKAFLPSGEKSSRVAVVGTVTDIDNVGTDGDYWRVNMTDTTDSLAVMVGDNDEQPLQTITDLETPSRVCVIGKVRVNEGDDGTIYSNLRPESISVVDSSVREQWVMETAERTLERLEQDVDDDLLETFEGIYGDADEYQEVREDVKQGVVDALEHLDENMSDD